MLRVRSIAAGLGALVVAAPVRADVLSMEVEPVPVDPYRYAWTDSRMVTLIGVGISVGGGFVGFTDESMRRTTDKTLNGGWDVRVALGTHIPLGLELAYVGSAGKVRLPDSENTNWLVGTAVEATVRYTILPLASGTPYVFIGAGWQRYFVRNATELALAETGMSRIDHVAEFPMGLGVAYRDPSGWFADLRGTFRATTGSSLLTRPGGGEASLDSWEASGAIGYEF